MKVGRFVLLSFLLVILFLPAITGANATVANSPSPRLAEQSPLAAKQWNLPMVSRAPIVPPVATTSRYMSTTNYAALYNEGCSMGTAGQSGVVVLDFGQPRYQNSTFGTLLYDDVTFATLSQISTAAKGFLNGYWDCSYAGGFLTLALGTSNYFGATGYGHGQAWSQLVNDLGAWIPAPPVSYASKEAIAGANDIEMSWNTVGNTRAWVNGYDSINKYPYYDYGSCDGCAFAMYPNACPNWAPSNYWTIEDVYYVAWGASPANPLPEIYLPNGANAGQWYCMSLYAYNVHGLRMDIQGSFTQWQACGCLPTVTLRPEEGWYQLYQRLNADPRTSQWLPYSTDITQRN